MHCSNCGNMLNQGGKFCTNCGTKVQADPFSNKPIAMAPSLEDLDRKRGSRTVQEGTEVVLVFTETVSSSSATIGDRIGMELAENLVVGNEIFARRGASAVGTVTNCQKRRMLARGAELNIRVDYFKVQTVKVPLRANYGGQGRNRAGTAVALGVLVGPFALMKRGTDVLFQKGTQIRAYVDDDTEIPVELL